jgi:hypothetical protein
MAKIRINKIEAAQRQLDAAIRRLFANEDPVAIHTLAMAAFRILRDLAIKNGHCTMHESNKASPPQAAGYSPLLGFECFTPQAAGN